MTRRQKTDTALPTDCSADYEVGYGKPPIEHRFSAGVSGNSSGRPRKHRPSDDGAHSSLTPDLRLWLAEAIAPVRVRHNGEIRTIPAQEAVILGLRAKALAGGITANRIYLSAIAEAQRAARDQQYAEFTGLVELQLSAQREIDQLRNAGKSIKEVFPHPDDIIIDPRAGWATLVGPVCENERAAYTQVIELRSACQQAVSVLAKIHAGASPKRRSGALADWHDAQVRFDEFNDCLPPSMKVDLTDRSVAPGASRAGQFHQFTPEAVRALQSGGSRRRKRSNR